MKLLLNLVQKDFKKNRVITTVLAIFLVLSALLTAGGFRIAGIILSSVNGLNEQALPPEYIQMHKGTYDEKALWDFIDSHDYIKDSLVVNMLDISNANIIYQGETLEKYLMDNGFVTQNEGFDYLLNMKNEIAVVKDGEIGVPVYYAEELGIKVGDILEVKEGEFNKEFKVSTIIRDASMNAALTSSKRFLISQNDQRELSLHMGQWEYCFEFLVEEGTKTAALEKDYMDAGLPSNGVAVTGSLLTLMNAFSYGLIAFIIIVISILLIMIAILCLSYVIRATMAEENRTIGEMKAIGFPKKEIGKLYLMKYIILMMAAGVIGFLSAIPFGDFFASSVILYCGKGTEEWMKWMLPLLGMILLCLLVTVKCRRVLHKNLNSTVVELMHGEERKQKEGHYSLPSAGLSNKNITIALGELRCKWREYLVIFFVFAFSSFLILLPMNMKNTIEEPSFISYMGVGECDIRIDIQYSEQLEEQKNTAAAYLEKDSDTANYAIYQNGYVQYQNGEGEYEYLRVEAGDESVFPLEYLEGKAPEGGTEMALSYLIAAELGKKVGDTMIVSYQGEVLEFTVTGIYQDITYGGKTAKADIDFEAEDIEVYIIYLDVNDDISIHDKTEELRNILTDSKITPIQDFISQTLSGVMDNMGLVEGAAIVVSLLLILLVSMMFLQLTTAREHSAIAIKKALGFSTRDIRIQFGIRLLVLQVLAIVVGTVLANTLGEAIFGVMLSFMGVAKITLILEPVMSYLLSPAVQLLVVLITVVVGTGVIRSYHIRDQIME